ncbi:serine/threonine-protein kinase [Okeania sp. SIO2B9]|uniref:serine/threonine-protein kinase n=1 Tax=Okeania sp. SIO2B9 TaxID=2607782 RepID=UPI00142BBCAF|nr:serine/threonine-protein kinase [Okeania sp. SIO2B9]NES91235.1 protein kinase [Okeania sp. SIO2B9]
MNYCLKENCKNPNSPPEARICLPCGSMLLLKDRYRAIKMIGQGGFSKTYLAVDQDKPSKPPCIIKQFYFISQNEVDIKRGIALFEKEAEKLDTLGKHPQIAELLANLHDDYCQYLVQEFIPGKNLAQVLETEGIFSEYQIRELLNSLLPVLEFIHSHNIIHQDIKPENIIRRLPSNSAYQAGIKGQFVLVDFDVAKQLTGTPIFKPGTILCTPEYVAPEQLKGRANFASDLYSLGVTCINLLTNISPFKLFDTGENKWVWRDYLIDNPISKELGNILDKLITAATNKRYKSATDVLKDLKYGKLPPPPTQSLLQFSFPKISLKDTNYVPGLHLYSWGKPQTISGHLSSVSSVAISPDNQMIASGSFDRTIKLWKLSTGELLDSFIASNIVLSIAFNPKSNILAIGNVGGIINIWDLATGTISCSLSRHSNSIVSMPVVFSPNGDFIASGSDNRTIKIWHQKTCQLLYSIKNSRGINVVAFSPDGKILASGSSDNVIKLWEVETGNLIDKLIGHSRDINTITFSPDGKILVSGSSDKTIKLWSVETGKLIKTITGHSDLVRSVICLDKKTIISGSADKTIKIWQMETGEVIKTLNGHTKDVNSVAISGYDNTIVSGSSYNTVKIWCCE